MSKQTIVSCAYHPFEYSANRIKLPDFLGGKWVNVTQDQYKRIMRRRTLSHGACPSCFNLIDKGTQKGDYSKENRAKINEPFKNITPLIEPLKDKKNSKD